LIEQELTIREAVAWIKVGKTTSMQPSAPKGTPFSRQDRPFSYRSGKPDNLRTFVSSPQLYDRR
jgi:hypothetical protein